MDLRTRSRIAGIGAYLPPQKVSSEDLMFEIGSRRFGIPENFISRRIGILERRFSEDFLRPSDMAYEASVGAIEESGIHPLDIDWIIFCGIDRDWKEPATACRVQHLLGATNATCLDVSNACLGFMNGLAIADAYIASGAAENVLVCTGERQSAIALHAVEHLRKSNDKTLFRNSIGALTVGDAGGAMVIQRSDDNRGFGGFHFWTEADKAELCCVRQTASGYEGQMIMGAISKAMIELHTSKISETYSDLGWESNTINSIYCHQVGKGPHSEMSQLARVEESKAPITYTHMGNLTSATIPVNMHINRPKAGDRVLLLGAGSGLSICQAGMSF